MDYVGTVAFLDEDAALLATRKYRLPADGPIGAITERMLADVHAALVQRPVRIAVVQDGAPELWRAISTALADEPLVADWTEVLDWYHLDERLTKCLDLCVAPKKRAAQRKRWHALLLERDDGTHRLLRSLRCMKKTLDEPDAEQLQIHINYLVRNRHRTAYAACRRSALPIGSGITEGACKSLVAVRAKRSGQRWSQRGLSAALHLRAILDSDRFDSFWHFFARRYRAKHIVEIGSVRH